MGTTRPANSFRRASRIVTWRHSIRRRVQITRRNRTVVPRVAPSFAAAARALLKPGSTVPQSGLNASAPEVPTTQQPPTSEQTSSTNAQDVRQSAGNETRITVASEESGDAGSMPDASPEFRGEMGALLSYYAARIAAARMTMPSSAVAAIVQAIINEQTAAMRALTERWQAASEKQRADKPERPKGPASKNDGNPKL